MKKKLAIFFVVVLAVVFWRPAYAIVTNAISDFIQISAPSNPPSGQSRVYVDSGTKKLACLNSDGSSCAPSGGGGTGVTLAQLGVGLASLTDPNTFTWSWFNQASSTITTNGASLVLFTPNSSANNLSGRTTPVSGATPYTVTLGAQYNVAPANFSQCGIAITDGTNFIIIRYRGENGAFEAWTWTSFTTPTSNLANSGTSWFSRSAFTFFQIQETSVTRFYRYSTDGANYYLLFSEAKDTFLTTTAAGFFCLGNGQNASMTAVHFTATNP